MQTDLIVQFLEQQTPMLNVSKARCTYTKILD